MERCRNVSVLKSKQKQKIQKGEKVKKGKKVKLEEKSDLLQILELNFHLSSCRQFNVEKPRQFVNKF